MKPREYFATSSSRRFVLVGAARNTVSRPCCCIAAVDGPVLGVHIVGDRVGELIAEAQLIYNWEARPDEVAALIHPHPTQSEAIGEAHLMLAGKPLHVHG